VSKRADATKRAACGVTVPRCRPFDQSSAERFTIRRSKTVNATKRAYGKAFVDIGPVAADKRDQTGGRLDDMIDETTCLLRRVALARLDEPHRQSTH
jgi:hypothetical protein